MRGLTSDLENESALSALFVQFGPVVQATVRHRIDGSTGQNTSWALVTLASRDAAEKALDTGVAGLRLTPFSSKQAAESTGKMGAIRQQAAARSSRRGGGSGKLAAYYVNDYGF